MSTNSINFQLSGTIVGFSGESIPPLNTYTFKWAKLKVVGMEGKTFYEWITMYSRGKYLTPGFPSSRIVDTGETALYVGC